MEQERRSADDAESAASERQVEAAPAAEADWRVRAENAERELALRRALNAVEWIDPEDAYAELLRCTQRDEQGGWRVAFKSAQNETGAEGGGESPGAPGEARGVTPDEAVRALAARKPHWVKARVRGGSGAGSGMRGTVPSSVTYADLLKPENEWKLREYLHQRPDDLERLRRAHYRK